MTQFDWDHIRREKDIYRATSAAQSFAEKLRVLDRLRERDTDLRQARERSRNARKSERTPTLQTDRARGPSGHIHLIVSGASALLAATAAPTLASAKSRKKSG